MCLNYCQLEFLLSTSFVKFIKRHFQKASGKKTASGGRHGFIVAGHKQSFNGDTLSEAINDVLNRSGFRLFTPVKAKTIPMLCSYKDVVVVEILRKSTSYPPKPHQLRMEKSAKIKEAEKKKKTLISMCRSISLGY
ncbi:unnamed protein product [Cochlearia groenlandica]